MGRNVSLLLAASGGAALSLFAGPAQDPDDMSRYFVGLIRQGPEWSAEVTEASMELQEAHLGNIARLAQSGQLVLAGPFEGGGDLRGLFFFDVETEKEARALADSDPAVEAGRLVVDILPWWGTSKLKTLVKPAGGNAGKGGLEDAVVEASCGQCQFDLEGDGCDLAVRIEGQAFFVSGTGIDDHGDAHADDGFCNAVRRARVTGHIEGDRFVASAFELVR